MEELDRRVSGKLAVREGESEYFVVWAGDPDDWIACFEKDAGFPAREWAENMVLVYNRRVSRLSSEDFDGRSAL